MMYQVGVTGGIGSGKTLVCTVFEKLGIPVYYADIRARWLMNNDRELMEQIRNVLGEEAYVNGILERKKVAGVVFKDREILDRLNQLVHPVVKEDFRRWSAERKDVPYVIEEAAILFESGSSEGLDETILVYADEEVRIRRVMKRDGSNRDGVQRRMKHQMDEELKIEKADHVIYNNGEEMLLPQIVTIHQKILERS